LNKKLIEVQEKITDLLSGKFDFNQNSHEFEYKKNNRTFSTRNTASGLKQLGIIQLLLENRKLAQNGYLLMDEPEVHLHPEWQIRLAEILVLLAKELNIRICINSHSPQFIEAIEVYSASYDIRNDVNFYLSEAKEENGKFNISKIDRNDLIKIYDCLGKPYDEIDKIRGEIDAKYTIKGRG
jgi:predicted ATPase